MAKIKKLISIIVVCAILFFFGKVIWDGIASDIIPWSRTRFSSHQDFICLLKENHSLGAGIFAKELPENREKADYYWHRNWSLKQAAYSAVLTKEEIYNLADVQVKSFYEEWNDAGNVRLYIQQDNEYKFIDDSEWFNQDLEFIKKVMAEPEVSYSYYFYAAAEIDTADGVRYGGIILNDTTNEYIEFSFEKADEKEGTRPVAFP